MIIGVKESSFINKIFTMLNITVLSFIIITGATKANFNNWSINVNVRFLIWSCFKMKSYFYDDLQIEQFRTILAG